MLDCSNENVVAIVRINQVSLAGVLCMLIGQNLECHVECVTQMNPVASQAVASALLFDLSQLTKVSERGGYQNLCFDILLSKTGHPYICIHCCHFVN